MENQEEPGPGRALSLEECGPSRTCFQDMETVGERLPSALSPHLSSGVLQSTGDKGVSRPNSAVASLTTSSSPDSMAVSREELLMPQVNAASDHRPLLSAGSRAQCNLPGQTLGSSSSSFFCLCPSPHSPHCRESRYVSERRLKSITCWLKSRLS